jgi:copper chaperone NosL
MMTARMLRPARLGLAALAGALMLTACGGDSAPQALVPVSISPGTTCALDGMLLADYPGPKAQIHYTGGQPPEWFCDTIEMFNAVRHPEQARRIAALYVQDMGKADWVQPQGHWIDARSALYVFDSDQHGSMGPTAASFSVAADAERFIADHGGRLLRFDEVTPEMVALDGGAQHDRSM